MYTPLERHVLARELAPAMLAGGWTEDRVAESGASCLDRWPGWMTALAMRIMVVHPAPPVEEPGLLMAVIEGFLSEHPASEADARPPTLLRLMPARALLPASLAPGWPVVRVESVSALAERLELSDGQLAWLADARSLERVVRDERLRNYRYRIMQRPSGLPRVIESPKARLKEIQRWVLHEILDQVPPHESAHGFTRQRSVVSQAAVHAGRPAVLRLDLKDFFASITAARVFGLFCTLGYPRPVAYTLTGLCTNTIPQAVWQRVPRPTDPRLVQPRFWLSRQLATPHLPQGAPTSPALANLAAFRLDRRLAGLAAAWGLRYSRYADDLTFSGETHRLSWRSRLSEVVATIAREEGFVLNRDKSMLTTQAGRQRVCGVVINRHPNISRREYDRLRAILNNAARHGPDGQNRAAVADFEAHLRGRIAWVASVNPKRAEKLEARFSAIAWPRRGARPEGGTRPEGGNST
jgi:RNA-directed DNA polymerase